MTLTVEDGTIVADADSYVTLDAYQAYGAARGWTLGDTDAADEINLRRAFDAINRNWQYRGEPVNELVQVGAWPRYIIRDRFEYVVPADDIPQKVMDAQCEMAYLIQGGADPMATFDGAIKSESKGVGPLSKSTEYLGGKGRARYIAANVLLRDYVIAGGGQARMVRA